MKVLAWKGEKIISYQTNIKACAKEKSLTVNFRIVQHVMRCFIMTLVITLLVVMYAIEKVENVIIVITIS